MSETNELQSLEYPVRPLVPIPLADGADAVTDTDISQLVGVYPFDFVSDLKRLDYYSNQNITPHFKLILSDIDEAGGEVDISEYVTNWGSVTRSVDYLSGKMSPSSHSFKLANTKDNGDYLFTLRKNLGSDFWMGKEYNLYVGFYDGLEIDWINLYTGKITRKVEDRIGGTVSVNSHDTIKELNDYKLCSTLEGSDVFTYSDIDNTDTRAIQQTIKYGIHKLNTNGENKEITTRNNPFSTTECIPNLYNGIPKNTSSTNRDQYYYWFTTIQNLLLSDYSTGGELKVYYWDYRSSDKTWIAFDKTNFDNSYINFKVGTDLRSFFEMTDSLTMDVFTNWIDYITPISGEDFEPAIMIETQSITRDEGGGIYSFDSDPISILFDLLTNIKMINYDSSRLDYSSFNSPNINYSWDKLFNDYDGLLDINVSYDSEVSLMNVIDKICSIAGISFFANKQFSDTEDRRIELNNDFPINPNTSKINNAVFSTKDKISKYTVNTDNSKQKTKVIGFNFNSSISTKKIFEQYSIEKSLASTEFEKIQTIGKVADNVYMYNSGFFASFLVQAKYNEVVNPPEIANVTIGKAGFNVQIGELIDIHDAISNEKISTRVHNIKVDIKSANINVSGKRFQLQYGPDVDFPCRKWLFIDGGKIKDSDCTSVDDPSWYVF